MQPRVGQRVLITAAWSSFFRKRGTITQTTQDPGVFILLDDEVKPMMFEAVAFEVVVGEGSETSLTGAE